MGSPRAVIRFSIQRVRRRRNERPLAPHNSLFANAEPISSKTNPRFFGTPYDHRFKSRPQYPLLRISACLSAGIPIFRLFLCPDSHIPLRCLPSRRPLRGLPPSQIPIFRNSPNVNLFERTSHDKIGTSREHLFVLGCNLGHERFSLAVRIFNLQEEILHVIA